MEMNGNTATENEGNITMTNLTNTATALLAAREGVHPAHMANRLALAIRVVEAAEQIASRVRPATVITAAINGRPTVLARLTEVAAPASGTLSPATLALALEIASA